MSLSSCKCPPARAAFGGRKKCATLLELDSLPVQIRPIETQSRLTLFFAMMAMLRHGNGTVAILSQIPDVCPDGRALFRAHKTLLPQRCTLNVANICQDGYSCQSRSKDVLQGFCCSAKSIPRLPATVTRFRCVQGRCRVPRG